MENNNKEYEKKWKLYEKGKDSYTELLREALIEYNSEYVNLSDKEFIPALIKDVTKNGGPQHQRYLTEKQGLEMIQELNDDDSIPEKLDINFEPSTFRIREEKNNEGNLFYTVAIKGKPHFEDETSTQLTFNKIEKYWNNAVSGIEKIRLKVPIENYEKPLEIDYIPALDLLLVELEVKTEEDLHNLPDFGEDVSEDENYSMRILSTIISGLKKSKLIGRK
jgi:CYTH domain-containing protein